MSCRKLNDSTTDVLAPYRSRYLDLANSRLGAEAIYCTDDFFAPMERMLNPAEPVFIDDKYDDHGKWMDGWESRRKRTEGHDYCVVKMGLPGRIAVIDIDTRHFTGNFPPRASVEACYSDTPLDDSTAWTEILSEVELSGDSHNIFEIENTANWNHVRLHIYPDGGVARLKLFGQVHKDWSEVAADELVDLAAAVNGGVALACNDEHFGVMGNILMPGKGINMGDGWETRRRREPGNDWVIIRLGHPGVVKQLEVDTAFFKGNYPDGVSIEGCVIADESSMADPGSLDWVPILKRQKLGADAVHTFSDELEAEVRASHLRIQIYPDGGLSRVRVIGHIS